MKDRILKGFREEIEEKGLKFTMDDLAGRIGISKRTLYEHFSSKVEILDEIIEQTLFEVDEKTKTILEDEQLPLLEKIRGVFTVLPTHLELFDLRILEQMKRTYPEQWEKIHSELECDWDELRGLIEQGMQNGEIIDTNVSLLMKLFLDAANSTLDQKFFARNNLSVPEAMDRILDILLYGLIPKNKR
ncbi:MAG TPA: TetR/AcrR family transcriptional regulator [Bacillales bacterium]|nr:TetR/AcrR family transcriptional regulator [Bacillales bacterium]